MPRVCYLAHWVTIPVGLYDTVCYIEAGHQNQQNGGKNQLERFTFLTQCVVMLLHSVKVASSVEMRTDFSLSSNVLCTKYYTDFHLSSFVFYWQVIVQIAPRKVQIMSLERVDSAVVRKTAHVHVFIAYVSPKSAHGIVSAPLGSGVACAEGVDMLEGRDGKIYF